MISFPEDSERLCGWLRPWFAQRKTFAHAMALLRAAERTNAGVDTEFLYLAQAAEFLHRETIGGSLLPEAKFDEVRQTLADAIPSGLGKEVTNTLSERLKYWNEPSFARRLKELCRTIQNPPAFLTDYKDVCNRIKDYRNTLTHRLPHDDDWLQDLSWLRDVLVGLIELYFCRLLGFTDEDISTLLSRNYRLASRLRSR